MDNTCTYESMFFAPTEGNGNFSCRTVQDRLQQLKRQLYEMKMAEVAKNRLGRVNEISKNK